MNNIVKFATSAALLLAAAQPAVAGSAENFLAKARLLEKRAAGARGPFENPVLQKRAEHSFLNDKTQPFAVNGSAIPEVPFDVGESYAGLLPISSAANETKEFFFWFFPTTNADKQNETTIWINGGGGCSSLGGLLIENGPFTWEPGTLAPVQNPYTWVNLTNMLWIEQPIGAGYDVGTPNITNEYELSSQFLGFYKNFVDLFDTHGWKTYITGESYSGYYIPYIADAFIQANDTQYFDIAGIAMNDPMFGDTTLQAQMTIKPFVDYWSNIFYFNDSTNAKLEQMHTECGFEAYLDKYFKFPPPDAKFPVVPDPSVTGNTSCDIIDYAMDAATQMNPCFNMYHITDTCPYVYSVLETFNANNYTPPGGEFYWNRTDVKAAVHAPLSSTCDNVNFFVGDDDYDHTVAPTQNDVMQRVIEHTNNVIIGSGGLDFLLNTNGTLFALQNITWGGKQGFQDYPSQNDFFVPYHPEYTGGSLAGAGNLGKWGSERGLTFYEVRLSGHKLPGNTPGAGYRVVELMTGRIGNLSQVGDFTTQKGNFSNPT